MSQAQTPGKMLVDASVTEAKLATAYTAEVLKRDGSVALTGNLNAGSQRLTNLGAPTGANDAARLQDIQNVNRKALVEVASVAPLTLSGEQTVNGVALTSGDRILVKDQAAPAANGIYIVASGAWSRASDADSAFELNGAVVFVQAGSVGADTNWQQTATVATVGSDAITWANIGSGGTASNPSLSNKNMVASVTTGDNDAACATAMAATPAGNSYVDVKVNGISVQYGDGTKAAVAGYFSGDAGTTARAHNAIVSGDTFHWNGTVAGYELAASDRISFNYNVSA